MNQAAITPRRVALALGALVLLAFIGPAIGTSTFFYRDFGVLSYPTVSYHREMFWRGEVPLWNPYSNLGAPFLAQWGTMTLYPFSLFYLLLPLPWSLNFFCLGHLWWGALGVFYLARRWTKSNSGAAVASVLFLFNGLTLSTLAWPNYTVALAWMPWIIFGVERVWQNGRQAIPLAALCGAMQMFSGVPELVLLTWTLVIVLWFSAKIPKPAALAAVIGLVAGLCAIQLLPFFELLAHSHRQTGVSAAKWALPFTALPNFALPMLHAFQTPQGTWHQYGQHFLSSTYLGLPALFLAIIGAFYGGLRGRLLAGAAIVSVILALGPNLPTFVIFEKLPILGLARYPVKFALLLALVVPLLAAFGLQHMNKVTRMIFPVLLCLAGAAILWTKGHPMEFDDPKAMFENSAVRLVAYAAAYGLLFVWSGKLRMEYFLAFVLILAADGRFHLSNQNPTTSIATLKTVPPDAKLPKLGEGRVFITPRAEDTFLNSMIKDSARDFIGKRMGEWSHLNLLDLVPKVNGSATLVVREQKELIDWLYRSNTAPAAQERVLNFVGANKMSSPSSPVEWTNRSGALPIVRADRDATAEVTRFTEHEIRAIIKSPQDSALTVAQTKYPAWKAERDDGVPLSSADLITEKGKFQLYALRAGAYHVRIYYRDTQFIIGAVISTLSLLACAWLFARKPALQPEAHEYREEVARQPDL